MFLCRVEQRITHNRRRWIMILHEHICSDHKHCLLHLMCLHYCYKKRRWRRLDGPVRILQFSCSRSICSVVSLSSRQQQRAEQQKWKSRWSLNSDYHRLMSACWPNNGAERGEHSAAWLRKGLRRHQLTVMLSPCWFTALVLSKSNMLNEFHLLSFLFQYWKCSIWTHFYKW